MPLSQSLSVHPPHETLSVGILLAVVGGFLDAHTYTFRGGVFANAQTGNLVLLGVSSAKGQWARMGYYLIPILSFMLGVWITEYMKHRLGKVQALAWQRLVVLMEAIILFLVGFIPPEWPAFAANVTISFICSMQVNCFRQMKGMPYATTMCTGNLRSGTENLYQFLYEHNREAGIRSVHYFIIIVVFCVGAFLGAVLTVYWFEKTVWFCCLLLLAVFLLMKRKAEYTA